MSESEKPEKNGGVESQLSAESDSSENDDASALSGSISANANLNLSANVNLNFDALSLPGKKLLQTVGAYLGYAQGVAKAAEFKEITDAQAHGMVAIAEAYSRTVKLVGPEKAEQVAEQVLGIPSQSIALRRRAGTRLLHVEAQRQRNIESVASQAAQKLPENVSGEPVHPDWTARFFESVKDVSDETLQSLWASILAGEVEQPGGTSLRTLDVAKNLSKTDAMEFERFARFSSGGEWVFYPDSLIWSDEEMVNRVLPVGKKKQLQECGLVYHDPYSCIGLSSGQEGLRFTHGGFVFEFASPKGVIPVIMMTGPGKEIARFIPEKFPEIWYIRALAKYAADNNAVLRVISPLPLPTVTAAERAGVSGLPPPRDEATISPTASDDELRALLENCPRRAVVK